MTVIPERSTARDSSQSGTFFFDAFLLTLRLIRLMYRRCLPRVCLRFGPLLTVLLVGAVLVQPVHAQSSDAPTGTLTVQVDGLDGSEGTVRAELTTAKSYDADGNVRAAALPIQDGMARWTIEDVSHGTYAVRLYHDEDDNGELDTNMFGVPQEAFGFSNDARSSMGPPDFDEAAVTLASDSLSMTVTVE